MDKILNLNNVDLYNQIYGLENITSAGNSHRPE